MRRDLSVYLDLLRFGAAIAVFFSHISLNILTGGFLWQLQFIGHDAVIVFFVLSGFVIQYAVATKEKTLRDYEIARLARLYSVVIPALFMTYIFDTVGFAHHPSSYLADQETDPILRLAASITFLGQSWGWRLATMSNTAFWSLPYEFWYYQIFGAFFFFKGWKRVLLVSIGCLIAGPAILGFSPLWLAGVAAYRAGQHTKLNPKWAGVIFVSTLFLQGLVILAEVKGLVRRTDSAYLPHAFNPIDYLAGFSVATNIYAAMFIRLPLARIAKPVAAAAGITFALYLLHLPIFHLLAAFMPANWSVTTRGITLIGATLLIVIGLSFVTERRKKQWRAFFRWLLGGNTKVLPTPLGT